MCNIYVHFILQKSLDSPTQVTCQVDICPGISHVLTLPENQLVVSVYISFISVALAFITVSGTK